MACNSIYNIFDHVTTFFSVCDIFARGRQRFLFQFTRILMEFTSKTRTPGLLMTFPATKKLSTSSKITKGTLLLELNATATHRMSVVVLKWALPGS